MSRSRSYFAEFQPFTSIGCFLLVNTVLFFLARLALLVMESLNWERIFLVLSTPAEFGKVFDLSSMAPKRAAMEKGN